jgi:hypothetical protein
MVAKGLRVGTLVVLSALLTGCGGKHIRTTIHLEPHNQAMITFGSRNSHEFQVINEGPASVRVIAADRDGRVQSNFTMSAPGRYGDTIRDVQSVTLRNESDQPSEVELNVHRDAEPTVNPKQDH